MQHDLTGRTVLVLEDEPLIALDVEMALTDAGAHVVGPVGNSRSALDAIDLAIEGSGGALDGAVLDVHLGTHTSEMVAARLLDLEVPFVFYTGNLKDGDTFVRNSGVPVIRKPTSAYRLVAALFDVLMKRLTSAQDGPSQDR